MKKGVFNVLMVIVAIALTVVAAALVHRVVGLVVGVTVLLIAEYLIKPKVKFKEPKIEHVEHEEKDMDI
ncbi:hypothetical protein D3C81_09120 [compost metagenome]